MKSMSQLIALEPLEWDVEVPEEELSESLAWLQAQRAKDVSIRRRLLAFSFLLTFSAPFLSFFFPTAWTYILATGVAFTIGTNLLISVVSTRVEDKADKMEERMVELMDSLNEATDRLQSFHQQLDSVNIPGVQNLLEDVRDELAPGLQSLDDVDIGQIAQEIRRASRFVDTLDMEKLGAYLNHVRKDDYEPAVEDEEINEYWDEPVNDLPSILSIKASQDAEKDRQSEILARLIS